MRHSRVSTEDFLGRMREYMAWQSSRAASAGDAAFPSRPNWFYSLNSETMLALTRAVEDLALEDADGRFLCSFQDFGEFQSNRERYEQISATLDEVLVLGVGKKPRACGQVQFLDASGTALERYWIAMYQGASLQVLAICRQINEAKAVPDKLFRGFFTFDPRTIGRVRRDTLDTLGGRVPAMPAFERSFALDQAAHEVRDCLASETASLELQLEQLRQHPAWSPRRFLKDLGASVDRFSQLRDRVAALFDSSPEPRILPNGHPRSDQLEK